MSDSLQPYGLQHTTLPCPSLSSGVCSNSYLLNRWCHPTTPSPVTPFTSCPQSFSASRSFPRSKIFSPGGQIIGALASHPSFQWIFRVVFFRMDCCSRDSQESSPVPQLESIYFSVLSLLYGATLTSLYLTTGKPMVVTIWTFVRKMMSLLINSLSVFLTAFLPRSIF